MYDLRDSGTTVLFVSHSIGMVRRFCTEAILLHKGRLVSSGEPAEVVDRYRELLDNSQDAKKAKAGAQASEQERQLDYSIEHEDEEDTPFRETGRRTGHEAVARTVTGTATRTGPSRGPRVRRRSWSELRDWTAPGARGGLGRRRHRGVHLQYLRAEEDERPRPHLTRKRAELEVFATSTAEEGAPLGPRERGERVLVDFAFAVPLRPGRYAVDVAVTRGATARHLPEPGGGRRDSRGPPRTPEAKARRTRSPAHAGRDPRPAERTGKSQPFRLRPCHPTSRS